MGQVIPFRKVIHQQNAEMKKPLEVLRVERICWDGALSPDLEQGRKYLYVTFRPCDSQLSRSDLKHLVAIRVRGAFWLDLNLVRIMKRKSNWILIFSSETFLTRMTYGSFTYENEKITFHFLDNKTGGRSEIVCQP